jgi:hypothetical protein
MKIKLLFFFLVSAIISFSAFSQEINDFEKKQVIQVATILENSATAKMDAVWPGYNLRSKPFIITFGNGHIYAFNIKLNQGGWERIYIDDIEVFFSAKDRWGITASPMQFDFEIQGQQAFVFRLDMMPDPAFLPFFVMVHERFHVYQIQSFASEKNDFESEYPEHENVENLTLMQLEELVLLDFLKALNNSSNEEALLHLKKFISVNKERRKLLSSTSVLWEGRQQMVEGLADYTAARNLDVFAYFGEKIGQKHILNTMEGYTKDDDITARALKWRHYGVGASLAYALDFLKVPHWKQDVENNIPLQTILDENLKVSQAEADFLFQQAVEKYNVNQLQREIKQKIDTYNNMIHTFYENFKNLPGIIVNIESPPDSGLSAGGQSRGVYSLADGTMLSVEDTSKTSSADNLWLLEIRSTPYLFQTNEGFRRFKVAREEMEIMIDGKPHSLNNIKQKRFKHLTLKCKSCSFKSIQNEGTISMKEGELTISYQ